MEYGFIFDMDGVVIDSNPYHKIAWESFLERMKYPFDEHTFIQKLSGRTGPTSLKMLFGESLSEDLLNSYLEEVDGNYQDILRQQQRAKAIAGAPEFIREAKNSGIRIALATSAPPLNIEMGLEKLDMRGIFDVILGKVDVVNGKPHPEVYQKAVEQLGLPPEKCVVFEDSKAGIRAGLAAGLPVVGIASEHGQDELIQEGVQLAVADFTYLSLEKVIQLIKDGQ